MALNSYSATPSDLALSAPPQMQVVAHKEKPEPRKFTPFLCFDSDSFYIFTGERKKSMDFEDRRRRTCCGNICVNMCYFCLTILLVAFVVTFANDVYLKYQDELRNKRAEILKAQENYDRVNCAQVADIVP